MTKNIILATALLLCAGAWAKLPAPGDEAKAKAAEAAAKAAHGDKVAAYQLCKSREKVAAHYEKTKGKGKLTPTATPACVDPGAYKPTDSAAMPTVPVKPAAAAAKKG